MRLEAQEQSRQRAEADAIEARAEAGEWDWLPRLSGTLACACELMLSNREGCAREAERGDGGCGAMEGGKAICIRLRCS
jgi:hypothetical protein